MVISPSTISIVPLTKQLLHLTVAESLNEPALDIVSITRLFPLPFVPLTYCQIEIFPGSMGLENRCRHAQMCSVGQTKLLLFFDAGPREF
jgi:hypothetical protein